MFDREFDVEALSAAVMRKSEVVMRGEDGSWPTDGTGFILISATGARGLCPVFIVGTTGRKQATTCRQPVVRAMHAANRLPVVAATHSSDPLAPIPQ